MINLQKSLWFNPFQTFNQNYWDIFVVEQNENHTSYDAQHVFDFENVSELYCKIPQRQLFVTKKV